MSVLLFNPPSNPPLTPPLPRKCFLFISRDAGLSLAQNFRVFNAPNFEGKPRYAAAKGCYAAEYSRLLHSSLAGSLQRSTSTLLQRATPQRGVLRRCVPEAPASLLILFSASSLFFYWLASFFIFISSCPVKYYNMED